ncbi:MAG TPA: glutamate formimidoyltransferase [Candidatus Dormibacteraeota bacterium]|nr:glutamate formimidoyltransferase [Candidatus Dormibacteraeota bacterium]
MAGGGGPIVECVPNFSEGRDEVVIARLRAAVAAVERVKLLDTHSDPDHNRTVLTFAGPISQVSVAAMRVAREAVKRIDMRQHDGVHPRMGSIDVVPFAPLRGTSLDECAAAARQVARYLGEELGVPAFLYGAAAAPDRPRQLNQIRGRGHDSIGALGAALRSPDFGPPAPHPTAGAVVVGARLPLIAFNVTLDSSDIETAERVARSVRESSGGLRRVQALAFFLPSRGQVQVSTNLLDFHVTGLSAVLAAVRKLAAREGTTVVACELVGLLPAAALEGIEGETLPGTPGEGDTIESRLNIAGLS